MEKQENHDRGTRKLDRGYYKAKKVSQQWNGLPPGVKRGDIMRVVRRIGPSFGISPELIHRLDTLIAISQDQDWEYDSRPVVSPQNEWLMKEWDISKSQVQRSLTSMQDLGLLVAKDSPSGRRYFRRDSKDNLVEAYGFDLSPLAAKYDDLVKELELREAQFEQRRLLKRKFTTIRREISALFMAVDDGRLPYLDTRPFETSFIGHIERYDSNGPLPSLISQVEALAAFQVDLEQHIERLILAEEEAIHGDHSQVTDNNTIFEDKNPNGRIDAAPILNTKHPSDYKRSNKDSQKEVVSSSSVAPSLNGSNDANTNKSPLLAALDRLPGHIKSQETTKRTRSIKPVDMKNSTGIDRLRPQMIAAASKDNFAQWLLNPEKPSWDEIIFAGQQTAKSLQLTETDWRYAAHKIGPHAASVAVMILSTREADVTNMGGYLKGMLKKADDGNLHLHKSVYGILNKGEANKADTSPALL